MKLIVLWNEEVTNQGKLKIHCRVHHSGRQREMEKVFLWAPIPSDCILGSGVGRT